MAQRYERVESHDVDEDVHLTPAPTHQIPSSPPPPFTSRTPSPSRRRQSSNEDDENEGDTTTIFNADPLHDYSHPDPPTNTVSTNTRHPSTRTRRGDYRPLQRQHTSEEQTLADTFGADLDGDDDDGDDADEPDDRQRLMRGNPNGGDVLPETTIDLSAAAGSSSTPTAGEQQGGGGSGSGNTGGGGGFFGRMRAQSRGMFSQLGRSPAGNLAGRVMGGGSANDGVFANLSAKPERGVVEKGDDLPPTYEQAAADATPPYWETTVITPGLTGDEVYVDGLPVGSIFSFLWNAMISTSFQLVGFLLTYLLHTTHAAKNGSRAGLGLTLVQYGFYMKEGSEDGGSSSSSSSSSSNSGSYDAPPAQDGAGFAPPDPNSHTFDPSNVDAGAAAAAAAAASESAGSSSVAGNVSTSEMVSYVLMIVGWFILIRAFSDYLRARKHEQLVLASPERGLPVPVVAEGERAETVV